MQMCLKNGRVRALVPCLVLLLSAVTGCSSYPRWLPSAGPGGDQVLESGDSMRSDVGIQILEVDERAARKLMAGQKKSLFSDVFAASPLVVGGAINAGDVIEVSIWEAPPAALFGAAALDPRSGPATTRVTALPEQMIGHEGTVNVPFAGAIQVAGLSAQQVEQKIAERLKGIANKPQVLVRVIRNNSSNVTVVGEVTSSTRLSLTAKGERLLDALAAAGGVRQPVGKMTVQLTRGNTVQSLPLDTIIRDPRQNIPLQPGDVVTSLFQPLSFTVLGATGRNEEVNFEAQGISLAQALARSGGLNDARADASGVFIFRFEDVAVFDKREGLRMTPEGRVPVVYRADMRNPATFLAAQNFPVRDKDLLYVSNASGAELQKFLNIVLSAAYPVVNLVNAVQ